MTVLVFRVVGLWVLNAKETLRRCRLLKMFSIFHRMFVLHVVCENAIVDSCLFWFGCGSKEPTFRTI